MYYIIRRGDSLHSIAMQYGTTVSHLMNLNPKIRNPHQIYPGERIEVSSGSQWGRNQWHGAQRGHDQHHDNQHHDGHH